MRIRNQDFCCQRNRIPALPLRRIRIEANSTIVDGYHRTQIFYTGTGKDPTYSDPDPQRCSYLEVILLLNLILALAGLLSQADVHSEVILLHKKGTDI